MREQEKPCPNCRQKLYTKVIHLGDVSYSSYTVLEDETEHTVYVCLALVVKQRDGAEAALGLQTDKAIRLS